jgi:hypothetical protein
MDEQLPHQSGKIVQSIALIIPGKILLVKGRIGGEKYSEKKA